MNGWTTPPTPTTGPATTAPGMRPTTWATAPTSSPSPSWIPGSYDPDDFYTRATNPQDHAERVSIKVRPDFMAMLERLIASKAIPEYGTPADFFRDSAIHRMHYVKDRINDPAFREQFTHLHELIRMEQMVGNMEMENKNWADLLQRTRDTFTVKVSYGDWWGLTQGLSEVEEQAANHRQPIRGELEKIVVEFRAVIPEGFDPEADVL